MIDFTLEHCVYVTKMNNYYYIGKGKTEGVLKGGYKGSGFKLKDAFKKYPRMLWTTDIIATFINSSEAYQLESILVTKETLKDPNCFNLSVGGVGGHRWASAFTRGEKISLALSGKKRNPQSPETIAKRVNTFKDPDIAKKLAHQKGKKRLDLSEERRKEYAERMSRMNLEKYLSEESVYKRKITQLNKIIKSRNQDSIRKNSRIKAKLTLKERGKRGSTDKKVFVNGKEYSSRVSAMDEYNLKHFYQLVTKYDVRDLEFSYTIEKCKIIKTPV